MLKRLWRWLRPDPDAWLNAKIAQNTARYRPGMETYDPEILNQIGAKKWNETERAQRRLQT